MGIPVAKRGAAIEKVPCCWGCGLLADRAFLAGGHEANECPRRIVQCRNVGCKVELLQAWELVDIYYKLFFFCACFECVS
jgi:hypothetical protein